MVTDIWSVRSGPPEHEIDENKRISKNHKVIAACKDLGLCLENGVKTRDSGFSVVEKPYAWVHGSKNCANLTSDEKEKVFELLILNHAEQASELGEGVVFDWSCPEGRLTDLQNTLQAEQAKLGQSGPFMLAFFRLTGARTFEGWESNGYTVDFSQVIKEEAPKEEAPGEEPQQAAPQERADGPREPALA